MQNKSSKRFDIRLASQRVSIVHREDRPGILVHQLQRQADELKNHAHDKMAKGYKVLVSGPPGTGMAFIARLQAGDRESSVYRIDLSKVVSPYIGETEKNLALLFAHAEKKHWILFFDEADALFGKRTTVKDAHDRYANLEISYLLQQIEAYNGVAIIAVNSGSELDHDCVHCFDAVLDFPLPG